MSFISVQVQTHVGTCLLGTARLDGRSLAVLNGARLATAGLDSLDDLHGLLVSDLAEDDVAAIEPAGDDGGDEELGAVAELD